VKIPTKKIEIFCGTGGVGKTTIATARALCLAQEGKKVLLITIDPAKRLKQILNLKDDDDGFITSITDMGFDAMLMSPRSTFKKILGNDFENNIIKNLSRPHGGMNEIMSIIEVQMQLKKNYYDVIVLDTPPGKHFLDFLESSEKIKNFFDKTFVEIFTFYVNKSNNFIGKIFDSGIRKLLSYLENVTGAEFVTEFINTVYALYQSRDTFLAALNFQDDLKREDFSNWFLVTSVEQEKMNEAEEIKQKAYHFMHADHFLIINKSVAGYLKEWHPDTDSKLFELKDSLLKRELDLATYAGKNFKKVLKFSEVIKTSPIDHVKDLADQFTHLQVMAI